MPTVQDVIVRKPTAAEEETCRQWPTWGCDVSEFDWSYDQTETCLILEGEITVCDRPESEASVSFKAGDYVVFPQGLQCIWKVTQPVKKHYQFG